jgi:hypothetical protein
MADKVFKPSKAGEDTGSQEGIDLILAVAWALRSHEESETKSRRLKEAFEKKRQRAGQGKEHVSKTVPWWLTIENGKIVAVPERTKVLKRIYRLTAQGWSSQRIARKFNEEGLSTWRPRAKEWQDSRIRDAIRYDAALGYLCPTAKTKATGLEYRIGNYYPRVVSNELAAEARGAMHRNRVLRGEHDPKSGRPLNLFRGLLRHEGRWCRFQSHRNGKPDKGVKGWHGYYDDHDPNQSGKKTWSIAASQLEPVVVHCLRELSPADLLPSVPEPVSRSTAFRSQVQAIERRIANIVDAIASGTSKALHVKLEQLETSLAGKRQELQREMAAEVTRTVPASLLRSISPNLHDPETRARTAKAIRRLVSRIDVAEDLGDLPTSKDVGEVWESKVLTETCIVDDPVPNDKRRKKLAILVTFCSGAQRILVRENFWDLEGDLELYSVRVDRREDAHLFPPYPPESLP